jgi:hypothetical protein
MRGAKPSSGLIHLHKSFMELHFGAQSLPQAVTVQAIIDGKSMSTALPGQVCNWYNLPPFCSSLVIFTNIC